ncbi:hypothetical protein SAMN06309944_1679 [Micrococcales bacterium KH10]|nr:hypothetical protein SAMN06309944_1679 [Micrococcales bacterium KH10]
MCHTATRPLACTFGLACAAATAAGGLQNASSRWTCDCGVGVPIFPSISYVEAQYTRRTRGGGRGRTADRPTKDLTRGRVARDQHLPDEVLDESVSTSVDTGVDNYTRVITAVCRTEPPSHRATEPPSHRATEPPSHRATEPPSHRAGIIIVSSTTYNQCQTRLWCPQSPEDTRGRRKSGAE